MSTIANSAIDTAIDAASLVETFKAAGLAPPPPGTDPSTQLNLTLWPGLSSKLQGGWPTDWPAYDTSNEDRGIMGPWTANVAGAAPSCLVNQIAMDLGNWGFPVEQNTVNAMASQITEEVSVRGGTSGTFYGHSQVAGSEIIYWGVAFGTAGLTSSTGGAASEMGIIYVFSAALGMD